MTALIKYIINIFTGSESSKKEKSILDISSRDKKKLIRGAIIESNKMQKHILSEYKKKFPHERQQFYLN